MSNRGRLHVVARTIGVLVVVAVVAGCGQAGVPGGDLARTVGFLPAEIAGDGLFVTRGAHGSELLAEQLGMGRTVASGTTVAPSVRVVLGDVGGVVGHLVSAGFVRGEAPDGWTLLLRPDGVPGYTGVPAVAVADDHVVAGGEEQLRAVMAGGSPLPVPASVLEGADAALLKPAASLGAPAGPVVDAAALPSFETAVLTHDGEGEGRLALRLAEAAGQEVAVAASVRVRTAGPLTASGRPVIEAAGSLARDDLVVVDVRWLAEPVEILEDGLGGGLLDFLGST